MLRLTLLLCIGMYAALMIAGEDRGQLRPGLARAVAEGRAPGTEAAALAAPVTKEVAAIDLTAPVADKADPAPKVEAASVAAVASTPYVEPDRTVVQAVEEPIFTLSSIGNEPVPGAPGQSVEVAGQPAPEAQPAADGTIWYVTADSVNVRDAPSTDSEVLGKLAAGEAALVVNQIDGEWARIVIQGDGMEGYVALRYLSPQAAPGTP